MGAKVTARRTAGPQPGGLTQKNTRNDLAISRDIRRAIIADKSLSTYAHNVKVISENGSVTLKVSPGTRSGKTFRVKGRGVPQAKGAGDLLVTVEVAVPQHLTAAERQAIEALAEATTTSPRTHLGV